MWSVISLCGIERRTGLGDVHMVCNDLTALGECKPDVKAEFLLLGKKKILLNYYTLHLYPLAAFSSKLWSDLSGKKNRLKMLQFVS